MSKPYKNDWVSYWSRFKDLDDLLQKSFNLDETLTDLESELGIKLLSGDQMQIIAALEDRIAELSKKQNGKTADMQIDLFD